MSLSSARAVRLGLALLTGWALAGCSQPKAPMLTGEDRAAAALRGEAGLDALQAAMRKHKFSSADLTKVALAEIAARNTALHAVIAVNPDAVKQAKAIDARRKNGEDLGPLMGVPVLIKDNIETKDVMATTAGSLALKGNITHRDAPVVARLRAGGAIILGKTNLSEWANMRSAHAMSGWSGVGGLTRNPYEPSRSACGSSSGSGAAVAADLAVLAIGTETDGSVVCPSSMTSLAGLKPTVGLVSRTHVVPISHTQDTPGPMGHSVRDIALALSVMAGGDPADPATAEADQHRTNYAAGLTPGALRGVRLGVLRDQVGGQPKTAAVFEAALSVLRKAGAVLVDIPDSQIQGLGDAETVVLEAELKADLNTYLASTPATVKTRTLADLIAFNKAHAAEEMPYFGQDLFEAAQATGGVADPAYLAALAKTQGPAQARIDGLLAANQVAALIAPTMGPAWLSDSVNGDQYDGPSAAGLPAKAGYPHLTVPMGFVQGLPVGLSFIGPKWGEAGLLKLGYAFEQAAKARRRPGQ